MINQRHCPFCQAPASKGCSHLALATEGRDFVRRCIERCEGHGLWQLYCQQCREGTSLPEPHDFTWLETAFCDRFLKHLRWFGGMDYEWRTGPRLDQGGFWVLLWSRDPRRLWWELRDELDRKTTAVAPVVPQEPPAGLLWLTPR